LKQYDIVLEFPSLSGSPRAEKIGVKARPYSHEFIKRMGGYFEIIVFTASKQSYADKIVEFLDPSKEYISFSFYREHCSFVDGKRM